MPFYFMFSYGFVLLLTVNKFFSKATLIIIKQNVICFNNF